LITSGAIAGLVHYIITGVVNGIILRQELQGWMGGAGALLHPRSPALSMCLWAVMSLCYGIIGIWYYVGIRSRRGTGLTTALLVGLTLWIVSKFAVALDLFAIGIMPARIIVGQSAGGLVAIVLAIVAGARLVDRPVR
jgi:hypothetical protein